MRAALLLLALLGCSVSASVSIESRGLGPPSQDCYRSVAGSRRRVRARTWVCTEVGGSYRWVLR